LLNLYCNKTPETSELRAKDEVDEHTSECQDSEMKA